MLPVKIVCTGCYIPGAVKSAESALAGRPLKVRIDPEVPLVECDAVLIERVLANLLENAGNTHQPPCLWRSRHAPWRMNSGSASSTTGQASRKGNHAFDHVLLKPIKIDELVQLLRAL